MKVTTPGSPAAVTLREPLIGIRAVDAHDADALRAFYASLSADTRRKRFLGTSSGIAAERSRAFCTPDHHHAEGFVAVLRAVGPRDGRVVGHLCLENDGAGGIELAIAVADGFQRHGIGRRLFEAARDWACAEGIARITATAFADNSPVLRLLTSAPMGATIRAADGGLVDIEIPLIEERVED